MAILKKFVLFACFFSLLLPWMGTADAVDLIAEGSCGPDLTWTLDASGVLEISGTGPMDDHSADEPAPWFSYATSVETVVIQDGVTSIGDSAFFGCDPMVSVTIPQTLTAIGRGAFEQCDALSTVSICDLGSWCQIDFENSTSNPLTLARQLRLNGELVTSLEIPEGITHIKPYAFYGFKGLRSMTLGADVTHIGDFAFNQCTSLKNISFSESLESIGVAAFYKCTSLTEVLIPDGVESIGLSAFNHCTGLQTLLIPGSISSMGDSVFAYCTNLTSVAFAEGSHSIRFGMFMGCEELVSISLPSSMTRIEEYAFVGCEKLETLIFNGPEAEKAEMTIGTSNDMLSGAMWHWDGETTQTVAPTCTVEGYLKFSCSCCGEITQILPAGGHSYIDEACVICGEQRGYTLSGMVSSAGDGALLLELSGNGTTQTLTITDAYTFSGLVPGEYELRISKADHVDCVLPVTVKADTTLDAALCLLGDVNSDGKVNMKDWNRLYSHVNEESALVGYPLQCADVTGDGKVNLKDWNRLYDHINEVAPLW